jgi:hypothetical protein
MTSLGGSVDRREETPGAHRLPEPTSEGLDAHGMTFQRLEQCGHVNKSSSRRMAKMAEALFVEYANEWLTGCLAAMLKALPNNPGLGAAGSASLTARNGWDLPLSRVQGHCSGKDAPFD